MHKTQSVVILSSQDVLKLTSFTDTLMIIHFFKQFSILEMKHLDLPTWD